MKRSQSTSLGGREEEEKREYDVASLRGCGDEERGYDSASIRGYDQEAKTQTLSIADRLQHFTWAWYTCTMSTGGIAILVSPRIQPHTFRGLETIGKVLFIWDLFLIAVITALITFRFIRYPGTFTNSIKRPPETIFFSAFFLTLSNVLSCMIHYAAASCGPWILDAFRICFWIYFVLTFCSAVGHYMILFTNPELKIEDMTPAWDFPIFPFMISGTVACTGAAEFAPADAMPMIVAGLTAQGLGLLVSIFMYACYIHRMVQYGLPSIATRPAMFIAVGPPSFTSLVIINMANAYPSYYEYFGNDAATMQIMRVGATMVSVFVWSLSCWFFFISLISCTIHWRSMVFKLNWWSFIFPNVGFTLGTIYIGRSLNSEGIKWVGSMMTVLLVCTYIFVFVSMIRAVVNKAILWPGQDEDTFAEEAHDKEEARSLMQARTNEA
ncbi:voltage-dependent anion channel-domain-containing protein [Phyllosticta citribraziliensis]|uniref:Voltage-dependent anion channel-domain-containing protein n=1 Tax=Phyllosticta citribraziliensis TaxID=989973 RepID=A0ABR1MCY1_9PEZI